MSHEEYSTSPYNSLQCIRNILIFVINEQQLSLPDRKCTSIAGNTKLLFNFASVIGKFCKINLFYAGHSSRAVKVTNCLRSRGR
jgi:hypothetical protein